VVFDEYSEGVLFRAPKSELKRGELGTVTGWPGATGSSLPPSCACVGTTLCFSVVEILGEKNLQN
jgi:hypothetical protein